MKWWKKALLATGALMAVTAGGIALMIKRVQASADSEAHALAWADKVAETAGMVFGIGLVAIWAVFFARENLRKQRLEDELEKSDASEVKDH